jgi:peptide/nickel transport system ATP-binding protein/glutathione transport system ATP-binding protein
MSSTAEPLLASQGDTRRPLVKVEGLRVEFQADGATIVAVDGVSFSIDPGETVCLVGESGSGKSVTSLSLMRLVEFGGGRISGGKLNFTPRKGESVDLAKATQEFMRELRGNQIGMIFQEPMTSLNPVFTIERQLVDGVKAHRGLKRNEARERALELLRSVRVPEPERRLKQYPHELSGGMRQRVVIAMAMACEPRLLIADEPTTALDVTIQAEILALIDRLKRENRMAVLFVTHDMAVVAQMADRVVVMYRGKIVEEGDVETIFENSKADYTRMLLAAVPKLGEMKGTTEPAAMRRIGDVVSAKPSLSSTRREPRVLLEVKNLTTRYPVRGGALRRVVANVHAVEDVTFSLNVGETFSLVGESGCGKSSCGRSILRLVEPQSGETWLNGREIRSLGQAELREARRDMQMVFQDPFASLNPLRRLRDQVAEPLINFGLASKPEIADRVAELFDRVDLPRSFLNRYPHELSGGQRQRVAIARAIAPHPSLVIADEAVSALDVSVQAQVLNLLAELQADLGLSFLFISHDIAVVERISHYVGVMYLGRLVELGPRPAVFEDPCHPYTKRLLSAVPVPDPRRRHVHERPSGTQIASPIYPLDHQAEPSTYDEVTPGHFVLRSPEHADANKTRSTNRQPLGVVLNLWSRSRASRANVSAQGGESR